MPRWVYEFPLFSEWRSATSARTASFMAGYRMLATVAALICAVLSTTEAALPEAFNLDYFAGQAAMTGHFGMWLADAEKEVSPSSSRSAARTNVFAAAQSFLELGLLSAQQGFATRVGMTLFCSVESGGCYCREYKKLTFSRGDHSEKTTVQGVIVHMDMNLKRIFFGYSPLTFTTAFRTTESRVRVLYEQADYFWKFGVLPTLSKLENVHEWQQIHVGIDLGGDIAYLLAVRALTTRRLPFGEHRVYNSYNNVLVVSSSPTAYFSDASVDGVVDHVRVKNHAMLYWANDNQLTYDLPENSVFGTIIETGQQFLADFGAEQDQATLSRQFLWPRTDGAATDADMGRAIVFASRVTAEGIACKNRMAHVLRAAAYKLYGHPHVYVARGLKSLLNASMTGFLNYKSSKISCSSHVVGASGISPSQDAAEVSNEALNYAMSAFGLRCYLTYGAHRVPLVQMRARLSALTSISESSKLLSQDIAKLRQSVEVSSRCFADILGNDNSNQVAKLLFAESRTSSFVPQHSSRGLRLNSHFGAVVAAVNGALEPGANIEDEWKHPMQTLHDDHRELFLSILSGGVSQFPQSCRGVIRGIDADDKQRKALSSTLTNQLKSLQAMQQYKPAINGVNPVNGLFAGHTHGPAPVFKIHCPNSLRNEHGNDMAKNLIRHIGIELSSAMDVRNCSAPLSHLIPGFCPPECNLAAQISAAKEPNRFANSIHSTTSVIKNIKSSAVMCESLLYLPEMNVFVGAKDGGFHYVPIGQDVSKYVDYFHNGQLVLNPEANVAVMTFTNSYYLKHYSSIWFFLPAGNPIEQTDDSD